MDEFERERETCQEKKKKSTNQHNKPCRTIHHCHSNIYHDYKKKLSLTMGTLVAALSVAVRQISGHDLGWQSLLYRKDDTLDLDREGGNYKMNLSLHFDL